MTTTTTAQYKTRPDLVFAVPGATNVLDSVLENVVTGELVGQFSKLTAAQLEERDGAKVQVFDCWVEQAEQSLTTQPRPISEEQFMDAFEALPPGGVGNSGSCLSFYMIEFTSGRVTAHYVKIGMNFFKFEAPVMNHDARVDYVLKWVGGARKGAVVEHDASGSGGQYYPFKVIGNHITGPWEARFATQAEADAVAKRYGE